MKNKGKVTVFRTSKELQALCQYLWFSNKRVESLKAKVNSDGKKLHKDSSYGYQKWVLAKYSVNWDKSKILNEGHDTNSQTQWWLCNDLELELQHLMDRTTKSGLPKNTSYSKQK